MFAVLSFLDREPMIVGPFRDYAHMHECTDCIEDWNLASSYSTREEAQAYVDSGVYTVTWVRD